MQEEDRFSSRRFGNKIKQKNLHHNLHFNLNLRFLKLALFCSLTIFVCVLSFFAIPTTEGTTKNVRAFNCVQRSHQQILETLPGYFITVLVAGLEYPVATFCFASVWLYSRIVWAKGYSASLGDVAQRYSHPHSSLFWSCMLALLVMSWLVAIQMVVGRKIFWDQLLPNGLF